jgi:hypothetical protein
VTRLLQAIAGARHGGAEAFFTRLAVALGTSGVTQRLAIRQDADRANRLQNHGLDVVELPFGGWFDLRTRPALRKLLAEWQPDLVLTWMNRATSLMPSGHCPIVARLGGYYDLKYYRRADHLIGNTEDIVRYIVKCGWPRERAHYLPNFVDGRRRPPVDRWHWAGCIATRVSTSCWRRWRTCRICIWCWPATARNVPLWSGRSRGSGSSRGCI